MGFSSRILAARPLPFAHHIAISLLSPDGEAENCRVVQSIA